MIGKIMNREIEINVARLDGYLSGIVSLNGHIRDYSAFAFLVEVNESEASLETVIKQFFLPHAKINFISVDKLTRGFRDLEVEIRPYLIRDFLGASEAVGDQYEITDRRKYLSFRVMDMISGVVGPNSPSIEVFKLEGDCKESCSKAVFFGIQMKEFFLILQFNDDTSI